jgi:ADP-dependent NAD(P)H-hydrate dehydratase / NAD(P)H-hydrate epimerase
MKLVTSSEMRKLEQESAALGIGPPELMENAGRAVAQSVRQVLGGTTGKRVIVLVGPGNNGGDGLVAARYLRDWGADVGLYLTFPRTDDDRNLKLVRERDIDVAGAENTETLGSFLESANAVVDAMFGTGQNRAITGIFKETLKKLTGIKKERPELRIFSVDLPSGLDADTGLADPATPSADYTLTLGLPKLGLYTSDGAARSGEIITLDIGLPPRLSEGIKTELMTGEMMREILPGRSPYSNKGTFGRALIVAGSSNYIGAAYLASAGAARVGAGLVTLAAAQSLVPLVAAKLAEAVYIPLPESEPGVILPEAAGLGKSAGDFDAVLIGPGLGQKAAAVDFIIRLISGIEKARLVLDADALNTLAKIPGWWQQPGFDAVLTPHPGEMARLADIPIENVQAGRVGLAMQKAAAWNKTVVLKGGFTVIAAPDGRCRVSPYANAGLASAGTGDVLAGAIAGLLAQGLSLFDSASLGVYLHARAGERVKDSLGDTGMLASDLLPELPRVIKELKEVNPKH